MSKKTVKVKPTHSTMTLLKEARRKGLTRHEGFDKQRSWRLLTLFPQERIPKRILEQIMTSTSGRDSQYAANTHVHQVVNTVEVKTLKILKKTMQGEKVDPDDDQSHKDQSDLFNRDSSEFSAQ